MIEQSVVARPDDPVQRSTAELLKATASLFLRAFDTIPLYQGWPMQDQEKWQKALQARKIASLLQGDAIPGEDNIWDFLSKWRDQTVDAQPEVLRPHGK